MGAFLRQSTLSFCLYVLLAIAAFELMQKLLVHFLLLLFFYLSLLLLLHPRNDLQFLPLLDAFLVDGSFPHELLHIPVDVLIDDMEIFEMCVLPVSSLVPEIFHQLHCLGFGLDVVRYLDSALVVVGPRNNG